MNAIEARRLTEMAEEEFYEKVDVSEFLKVIAQKVKLREYSAFFRFPQHKDRPKPEQLDKLRYMKYTLAQNENFNNEGSTDYNLKVCW